MVARAGDASPWALAQGAELVGIPLPAARALVAAVTDAANALMVVSGTLAVPLGVGWVHAVGQLPFSALVTGDYSAIGTL